MESALSKKLLFFAMIRTLSVSVAASALPDWLKGKPDIEKRPDRCGVYEWFFKAADKQTEGLATRNDLASQRLVNIANKLVDQHMKNPSKNMAPRSDICYLVILTRLISISVSAAMNLIASLTGNAGNEHGQDVSVHGLSELNTPQA